MLPTKNKMTTAAKRSTRTPTYDLLRQSCSSWRQRARHRRSYDENQPASVTRIAHLFPERETKRGQSIVRLVTAGGNAGPYESTGPASGDHTARTSSARLCLRSHQRLCILRHAAFPCTMPRPDLASLSGAEGPAVERSRAAHARQLPHATRRCARRLAAAARSHA